jgi:Fe(II)/alpha-ketoglutarate-dependent arginine beta-hydroxylase
MTDDDVAAVQALVAEVSARFDSVESASFHREARAYAEELPRSVRQALHEFRLAETSGVFVLSGLPVHDEGLGPTPTQWKRKPAKSPTSSYDFAFFLVATLLGEAIGWATQQDGRIMHDIFPMAEHAHEQIGWGSGELLAWHTEDAFHPMRTDYLGLMCLRNPDQVETTVADMADVSLDEPTTAVLFEERFFILPDDSHRAANQVGARSDDPRVEQLRRRSREQVERALESPEPVAVLFGSPESPYLRVDPYYMRDLHAEPEQAALDKLGAAVDAAITGVALRPGDICFIDNYRAVHGRKPFRARFDGTDRWLRRLNITRDLRKSRTLRLSPAARVIF